MIFEDSETKKVNGSGVASTTIVVEADDSDEEPFNEVKEAVKSTG